MVLMTYPAGEGSTGPAGSWTVATVVAGPVGGTATTTATAPVPVAGSGSGVEVSWTPLVVLGVAVAVALVVRWAAEALRRRRPDWWWPLVGAPVAVWRLGWTWRVLCEGSALVMPARRSGRYGVVGRGSRGGGVIVRGQPVRVVAPRRVRLELTGTGMVVTVAMLSSQVPGDYEKATEAMAHAWRVHQVTVSCPRPGMVVLTATGYDPLRHPARPPRRRHPFRRRKGDGRDLAALGPAGDGLGNGWGVEVLRVRVGVRQDGHPWVVDLARRPHHLVTGATQSGKSTLSVALVAGLAPRPVVLVGIDAKGGVELGPLGDRFSVLATTRAEAAQVLEALTAEVLDRMGVCRSAGVRSIWALPEKERPAPVVVVVDEVAELFLHADRAGKEEAARCVTALVRVAQLGAAAGVHLWVAGQRFGSDLGPGATLLRAQLAGRICHRVADLETAEMTLAGLGSSALDAAISIPADLPGVAVAGDDSGTWCRARSAPLSVQEAVSLTRVHAHLTAGLNEHVPALAHLTGGGAGDPTWEGR